MIQYTAAQHCFEIVAEMGSSPLSPRPRLDRAVEALQELELEHVPRAMRPRFKSMLRSAIAALSGSDAAVADALAAIVDLTLSICVWMLTDDGDANHPWQH